MTDPNLQNYIKQNLSSGFTEIQIRQTLMDAGWEKSDVDTAFTVATPPAAQVKPKTPYTSEPPASVPKGQVNIPADITKNPATVPPETYLAKHYKMMTLVVGAIIILPIVGYGVYWSYEKIGGQKAETLQSAPSPVPPPMPPPAKTDEVLRDQQRIADLKNLQTQILAYFTAKQFYPQSLSELISTSTLTQIPTDPKTHQDYLYIPIGNPALDFSLSFVLESAEGSLEKGLHEIAPGKLLPADAIQSQESAVRGITKIAPSAALTITDLSRNPFYPGEEIFLDAVSPLDLQYAVLVVGTLKLTDKNQPFEFQFSAPRQEGSYQVEVYGFTMDGQNLRQQTTFRVQANNNSGRR